MIPLKLPSFYYKTKKKLDKTYILDLIRKKYVLLTPEEWVRQHMLYYLISHLSYPKGLCCLEKKISSILGYYRADIVLCNKLGVVQILVECKSPYITLTNKTLRQIMLYHRQLAASYLLLTNGITHFCWEWNKSLKNFQSIKYIPKYIPNYYS